MSNRWQRRRRLEEELLVGLPGHVSSEALEVLGEPGVPPVDVRGPMTAVTPSATSPAMTRAAPARMSLFVE